MNFRFVCICVVALGLCRPTSALAVSAAAPESREKPRLLVLTDVSNEPDDEESLVRLLVYSNEYDIEGIVATTSCWLRDKVRPDLIARDVAAFGEVRANLLQHAGGYPTAEELRAKVKASCPVFGMAGVGDGKATEGSNWIIQAADRDDPRPLWIAIWGGANCLAQALWDVQHTRSPAAVAAFVAKLRVYAISDQDDAGYWIRRTFPALTYVVSPTTVGADEYYTATWTGISGDVEGRGGPREHVELVQNPWLTEHIRENHGPLGALYPERLYLMEGDTPSFLNLIGNGLAAEQNPGWGGWGGRYVLRQCYGETRPIWTNSRDTVRASDGRIYTSNQATIWRWREAFQHDFAARMAWCVKPWSEANHNPVAVVNDVAGKQPLRLSAAPGETVSLSAAESSDPDHNALSFRWFYYPEAGEPGHRPESLAITGADTATASVTLPTGDWPELHLILEVHDNGTPSLFSYRRIILTRRR